MCFGDGGSDFGEIINVDEDFKYEGNINQSCVGKIRSFAFHSKKNIIYVWSETGRNQQLHLQRRMWEPLHKHLNPFEPISFQSIILLACLLSLFWVNLFTPTKMFQMSG